LILAKKQKISSMKEYRLATIDYGILHGFTNTNEKDSGIYWLGRIPECWEIFPIKRICRVNASVSEIAKSIDDNELLTFLPMENVTVNGDVDCSIKKPLADVRTGYSSFAKGDVVVAKITPCFENGKGACLEDLDTDIGYGTTEFINLRPTEKVLSKYLYLITKTRPFRTLGEKVMTGSAGQKRVPVEFIKNFSLGIPNVEEQHRIINIIEKRLADIDNLIATEEKTIDVLHELRNKLISDVVTGQIDVRDIEIPEFEYVEEIEDISDSTEEFDEKFSNEEV
jgi:type I restriction enzyme S subunit